MRGQFYHLELETRMILVKSCAVKCSKFDPYLSLRKKQTKAFKVFSRWEEVEEELGWNRTLLELVLMGGGGCAHTGFADGCIPYPYITPQLFLTIHPTDLSCSSVFSVCFYGLRWLSCSLSRSVKVWVNIFLNGLVFLAAAPVSTTVSVFANDSPGLKNKPNICVFSSPSVIKV